jgi:hypothetical protein
LTKGIKNADLLAERIKGFQARFIELRLNQAEYLCRRFGLCQLKDLCSLLIEGNVIAIAAVIHQTPEILQANDEGLGSQRREILRRYGTFSRLRILPPFIGKQR